MKKKIIGIIGASLGSILLSAALAFGIFTLIQKRNVAETGNVLGVSWYDVSGKDFVITTADELYEVAELSKFYDFKGQTIKLGADIVVNEGNASDWAENRPKRQWNPIDRFAGTFDGQGHTISGLYGKVYGSKLALFTNTDRGCTIKNLSLVNTYFESLGQEALASFVATGGGMFYKLYSNAILESKGEQVAGLLSMAKKEAKFEECWFDGIIHSTNRDCGGLVDEIFGVRVTMKHCLFSGTITQDYTIGGTRTGAIAGKVNEKSSLILEDCLATGTLVADKTVYTGALVGVYYGGSSVITTDTYISSDVYHLLVGDSGDQGAIKGRPLQMMSDALIGTKAYEWTTLNFDQYWAAVDGGTPVLKCFGEKGVSLAGIEKAFDISWYQPGTYIYELTTLKQLYGMYILSAGNDFAEHTIKLGADIVVNEGKASEWAKKTPENPWFAINKFSGIFDGQGHTISGIYLKNHMTYQGFFAQVEPVGIVKNFSLKNSYFCNDSDEKLAMLGSVAGEFRGKLENVYSNAIVESSGTQVGGIFGRTNDNDYDGKEDSVVITNCWFDGEVHMKGQGGRYGAGFVGMVVQGDLDITHCLNTGRITAEAVNIGVHVGGFIASSMNKGVINMSDCLGAGTIESEYSICVGSVIGRLTSEERTINLTNVYATKECYPVTFFGTGEGGATTSKVNGGVIPLSEKMLTGYTAYQWTELDFANNWAIVKDGTPILKNFASSVPSLAGQQKMIDIKWYQASKKDYVIKTANELRGLALISNADTFKDKTIKLNADINLEKNIWLPIGTESMSFQGVFDGQGYTISGVSLDTKEYYGGLFGVAGPGAVVKNFSLTDSDFTYSGTSAAILGSVVGDLYGGATLENVYSNATVVSCGSQVGGMVGRVNDSDVDKKEDKAVISNCWFDGTLTLTGEATIQGGGIVGRLFRGDLDLSHCLNTGSISSEAKNRAVQIGGIIGAANGVGTFNLTDSLNTGKVSVIYNNGAGSVIGRVSCDNKNDRIVNIKDTYALASSYKSVFGNSANATINGGSIPLSDKLLTGQAAYQWTMLDFSDNWVLTENGTPIPKVFASKVSDVVPSVAGIEKKVNLDWYQADAKSYEIKTAEELRGFAILSSADTYKDKTVILKADINLNNEVWIPIGTEAKVFSGTFDGQGHTISGVSLDTKEYYGGLFGVAGEGAVLKNFKLTDSSFTYSGTSAALLGSVVGDLYGGATLENVYSNATVVSCGSQVGGMVGRVNDSDVDKKEDKTVISNCWFDGTLTLTGEATIQGGGIVGRLFRGDLDLSHCLNTGRISSEAKDRAVQLGGIIGAANGVGTFNLTDSLNIGKVSVIYNNGAGSVIGRVSCDNKNDRSVNIKDTYALATSYKEVFGNQSNALINGGTIPMKESFITGYTAYQWTTLDFDKNWAVSEKGTPILQVFASNVPSIASHKKMIDVEWYNADAKKYDIKTVEELRGFALMACADTFKDKTIVLKANIDLKKEDWIPIGSEAKAFSGTFNGQGHTISGVSLDTKEYYGGLFGVVGSGAVVKDFRLEDSDFTYSGTSAAILGSVVGDLYGGATLENVYSNATVVSCGSQVGGMVGRVNDNDEDKKEDKAVITSCWFDGKLSLTGETTIQGGGIVGRLFRGDLDISHCLNTGSISSKATDRAVQIGGIVGAANDIGTFNLTDSLNTGKIGVTYNIGAGSVIGRVSCDNKNDRIVNLKDTYALTSSYKTAFESNTNGKINGGIIPMQESFLTGYTAYQWTTLDFEDKWAVVEDDTPVLQEFAEKVPSLLLYAKLFDLDWYDAEDTKYELSTEKELRGLALLSKTDNFKEKTITLKADMNLKNKEWLPIGSAAKPFAGTFDGQMQTIRGVYLDTNEQTAGLFGEVAAAGTVSNFYLKDSTFNSTCSPSTLNAANGAFFGSVVGVNRGTVSGVYSDAVVNAVHAQVGGIVGRMVNNSSVKECWFDGEVNLLTTKGQYSGGVVGYAYVETGVTDTVFNIIDCLFTGKITTPASSGANSAWGIGIGGILGESYGPVTYTIDIKDCVSAGTIDLTYTSGDADGVGAVVGGIESALTKVKLTNVYGTNESCTKASRLYYLLGGIEVEMEATGSMLNKADIQGADGYKNTLLNFDNIWVAQKDNVPALQVFSKNITEIVDITNVIRPDRSWYNAEETRQEIKDVADLLGFMQMLAEGNTFAGKEVYLAPENPDYVFEVNKVEANTLNQWKSGSVMPENKWFGVGTKFAGTFDGQMNTIRGIYLNTSSQYAGLFGQIEASGVVKNFYITDSLFKSTNYDIGSVAGVSYGTVDTVYSNATIIAEKQRSGGIVGHVPWHNTTAYINNCWFDGQMELGSSASQSGGILGYIANDWKAGVSITNCLYTGSINFKITSSNWGIRIGGIVGGSRDYYAPTITIENCLSAGKITQASGSTATPAVSAVYGGFDEGRATILNLTNVYGTNECFAVARIYHQYIASGGSTAATLTIKGKGTMKAKADLLGTAGYQNTLLDFEENGAWVARKDNVPGLKAFTKVLGETVSIANVEQNNWYNANETVFGIGSASALKSLATYTNATNRITFADKTILLTDDIEVNPLATGTLASWKAGTGTLPTSWTPIGQGAAFAGNFDGQMHTISGIYMKVTNNTNTSRWTGLGMFAATAYYSKVQNFLLVDSYFQVADPKGNTNNEGYIANLGSIVGYHHGYMSNVYSNATIVSNRRQVGGIMGYSNSRGVTNVWYDGDMTVTSNHGREVGGIVGVMDSANTFENILFTGKITFDATVDYAGIGGLFGITYSSSTVSPLFKNVVIAGKLEKSKWANDIAKGSVAGLLFKATVRMENVYATTDTWGVTYNVYGSNTGTISGTITTSTAANLYGEAAKTNAPNLDYANVWVTRDGKVPALKIFVK